MHTHIWDFVLQITGRLNNKWREIGEGESKREGRSKGRSTYNREGVAEAYGEQGYNEGELEREMLQEGEGRC